MTCPCKDCTDRHEACWDRCERFLEYKKFKAECNRKRVEANDITNACTALKLNLGKELKKKKRLL